MFSAKLYLLVALAALAQSNGQAPGVKTTTTGVVIDVTVVDNNGQPVTDLASDDFELAEDGARQQISSITLVRGGVGQIVTGAGTAHMAEPGAAPARAIAPGGVPAMPSVTAILFDRLSPEVRPFAGRAALAYVATLNPPADFAGVFLADTALRIVQPFTSVQDSVRSAVTRVAGTAPGHLTPNAEPFGSPRIQPMDPNQPPTAGAESGGGYTTPYERDMRLKDPSTDAGSASATRSEQILARLELRMTGSYQQLLGVYSGQSSLAGLRAVVVGLSGMPGRKSILYFSEALPITEQLKSRFEALIAEANRANVTIFAVDAAGLRIHSKDGELNRNLSVAAAQGVGDVARTDGPYTRELEGQQQMLSSLPTAVLGRLARGTGGFLLENTNNLGAGVARMQQERTTYYLIAYQPTNAAMDGKFRKVSVKVKRPNVTVKARPGYLARAE